MPKKLAGSFAALFVLGVVAGGAAAFAKGPGGGIGGGPPPGIAKGPPAGSPSENRPEHPSNFGGYVSESCAKNKNLARGTKDECVHNPTEFPGKGTPKK
jgi:hypothetical protein